MRPFVAFHFAFVQDVAVLRPLALLAASIPSIDIDLLVAKEFKARDANGLWMEQIQRLGAELGGIEPFVYETSYDCLRRLSGRGMIVAGSESPLHPEAHELFRTVPGSIRTVTLQHGLECVGFLHNERHDATAGRNVIFAADIAVSWFERERLRSVAPSERSKIYVAGPTMMIDALRRTPPAHGELPGLVCENLHSVRFAHGRMREDFLSNFLAFAERLGAIGQGVTLRPHPAGRFTDRNNTALPSNVQVSRQPLYDLDLGQFAYVISAPSTILFDFAMAGVPAATWIDANGDVDWRNFTGLPQVASLVDWWHFNWAARWGREALIATQDVYLAGLGIPDDVRGRYAGLLALAA